MMRFTCVCLLLLSFLVVPAFSQNLLTNGSFETAGTGAIPAYWEEDSYSWLGLGTTIERVYGTDAVDGNYYVRITATEDDTDYLQDYYRGLTFTSTNYELEYNCKYQLSFWYRLQTLTLWANIRSYCSYGNVESTNPISVVETFLPYDDRFIPTVPYYDWKEHVKTFTTGSLGSYDWYTTEYLLAGYSSSTKTGDVIEYDNVRLELLERYLTSSVSVTTVVPLVYDYSNTNVQIEFLSNETQQSHSVEKIEGTAPGFEGITVLGKYWDIASLTGDFSATITFSYTDAELALAGLSEGNLRLFRKGDGDTFWEEVSAVIDSGANTIRNENPVSTFSIWAIADEDPGSSVKNWEQY